MPRVSIILTSYNHEKYIREAIDSVIAQTFTDFELIIWDDASSDNSWDIINSYVEPRIKAFRNIENKGPVYVLNTAITDVASGQYIAIHHSDDIWEKEKLSKQIEFLDHHPNYGAVFSNALAINEEGKALDDEDHFYLNIFEQPNRTRHQWLNYFFYQGNALCHPSVLIRKQCYELCGLYRYELAQLPDYDMWVRLCFKYEIYVLPEKLMRFRVRANEANTSGSRPQTRIRHATESYRLMKNFLVIENFDEMVSIFPESKKYYRADGFESKFVLAMMALDDKSLRQTKLFGIDMLFDVVGDTKKAKSINALYDFDYFDFIKLTGNLDVFSIEENNQKNQALQQLLSSYSWRITKPLRWLKSIIR